LYGQSGQRAIHLQYTYFFRFGFRRMDLAKQTPTTPDLFRFVILPSSFIREGGRIFFCSAIHSRPASSAAFHDLYSLIGKLFWCISQFLMMRAITHFWAVFRVMCILIR